VRAIGGNESTIAQRLETRELQFRGGETQMRYTARFLEIAQPEVNIITYRCAETPAGGAFFKIPLGLEVDALRLGWLRVGGGTEDICQCELYR